MNGTATHSEALGCVLPASESLVPLFAFFAFRGDRDLDRPTVRRPPLTLGFSRCSDERFLRRKAKVRESVDWK